ncbi:MAG: tRNA (adenosine(37)-N6)-threonylcarbamoyltransferase complex ATPase subunit type 1 TsaE [Rickettsiales bacterium]|nr:tRNA (adenosine(37)-N6)-threonylcarbamoyltransferase complex ATPase subunit type 1 TsaE [Rickettsiales bacterium]OUV54089.1 MAG: tRNA (adenosine(37)-N6)-threonylcarbamoyltransferase complex ATPase subunit type 1 TsaE [Rickettsiales bacterium TMED127]|tara:strand:- start:9636 stop:10112 length:477 start_codon:yes stop_codon:yes gene_type:complete
MKDELKIVLSSLKKTKLIANIFSKYSKKGLFISLYGALGTGKTTFADFLINSISKKKINVTSPTFSLVNIYQIEELRIWHYDLYRLDNKLEIFSLDFEEALDDMIIMEWPEIATEYLPNDRIEIKFEEDYRSKLNMKIYFQGNITFKNSIYERIKRIN